MYIYICIYIYQCIIYTYISHPLLTVLQFVAMLQIQTKFLLGVFVERWPPHRRHRRGDAKGQCSVTNSMTNSYYLNITNSRISKYHTRKRERRREREKETRAGAFSAHGGDAGVCASEHVLMHVKSSAD